MTVLLIGCGRMGGAMAKAWRGRERVLVFDPAAAPLEGTERVKDLHDLEGGDHLVVVLAVKPQAFADLAPTLTPLISCQPLVLSIMAGVRIAALGQAFGESARLVRAMPNTPAAIGKGISGAVAGADLAAADQDRVTVLLSAMGAVVWLDAEADLDRVTAVSGSGPAFVYRFAEALSAAGIAAGLSPAVAETLARATLIGAAALVEADATPLEELRRQVTSPGGTTAAGLAQMEDAHAIDVLMARVVAAATARSQELAGS